jgi:hypothetical protein
MIDEVTHENESFADWEKHPRLSDTTRRIRTRSSNGNGQLAALLRDEIKPHDSEAAP